jgi:hypothetical protein
MTFKVMKVPLCNAPYPNLPFNMELSSCDEGSFCRLTSFTIKSVQKYSLSIEENSSFIYFFSKSSEEINTDPLAFDVVKVPLYSGSHPHPKFNILL